MNTNIGIGINVWNGERTIKRVINSLLKQTYKNFTIYILDNKSTDDTVNIIKKIKKKKIKLIIDKKNRDIPSSQRILVNKFLIRHKYSMIANDDDFYHPQFIKECLNIFKNKNIDMAYCLYKIFDDKKNFSTTNYPEYNLKGGKFINIINFLIYRNIVPIFFGLYKSKTLYNSFKYYQPISNSRVNYDNQFMLHYLSNNNVECIKKKLFFYYKKDRSTDKRNKNKSIYNDYKSLILIYLYQFILLRNFLKLFLKNANFNMNQKFIIIILCVFIYLQKTTSYIIRFVIKKLFN
jgi:glycosyltransferase involved in cell wall biosynthesis